MKVAYQCDKKACEVCSNPTGEKWGCNHTFDIYHAKNFKIMDKTFAVEKSEEEKNDQAASC